MSRFKCLDALCLHIIILEYFDGPMSGFGFLSNGDAIYFRIIGWDQELWQRVFAIALVPVRHVQNIWDLFTAIEAPRKPIWCPASDGDYPTKKIIEEAILAAESIAMRNETFFLVESKTLVGETCTVQLTNLETNVLREIIHSKKILDLTSAPIIKEILDKLKPTQSE